MWAKLWPRHEYQIEPTILRTNHQIYSEAHTVLYHENMFVRVRSTKEEFGPLMINDGSIPKFLKGHQAQRFEYCAMTIDRDRHTPATQIESHGFRGKKCYVIALEDVQRLCKSFLMRDLYTSDMLQFKFTVTVHRNLEGALGDDPAPNSPQCRLLEPLTLLYGAPHFEIAGFVNEKYCASIAVRVARTAPTIKECLDEIIQLWDKGREYISHNRLRSAVDVLKMALCHLEYFYNPRAFDRFSLVTRYPEQELTGLIVLINMAMDLASSYYTLEEFGDAHFWAFESKNAIDDFPLEVTLHLDVLYAKAVYLEALSSTRLGKYQDRVDDLCDQLMFMDWEIYKDKELVHWRTEARALIKGRNEEDKARLLEVLGTEDDDRNIRDPDTPSLENW